MDWASFERHEGCIIGEITVDVSGPFRGRFSFRFESVFESEVFENERNEINFDSIFESVFGLCQRSFNRRAPMCDKSSHDM
jgi:hypothetical protein